MARLFAPLVAIVALLLADPAHALRIGESAQFVPGIGVSCLSRQGDLPGASGVDGNRTTIGVANPTDHAISCLVLVVDVDGAEFGRTTVDVPALTVVQVNDVFAAWGIAPRGNFQLNVSTAETEDHLYAYASIVRDGSGDAIFTFGTSPNAQPSRRGCTSPSHCWSVRDSASATTVRIRLEAPPLDDSAPTGTSAPSSRDVTRPEPGPKGSPVRVSVNGAASRPIRSGPLTSPFPPDVR